MLKNKIINEKEIDKITTNDTYYNKFICFF